MGWLREGGAGQWGFAQIGKKSANTNAMTLCGRSLAKLALTEKELKSIRVPMTVLVGDKDTLVNKLYVEDLKSARQDWPVVQIKNADHITCLLRPQFKEEIQKWLAKHKQP